MRNVVKGAVLACVGALLACLVGLVGLATAGAATYPPTTCAMLAVSTTTPRPGQTITVTGQDFKADEQLTLHLTPYGANLATLTTDGQGSFSAHVTLPLNARGTQLIKTNAAGKVCPADPIQIRISGSGTGGGGSSGGGSGQPPAMTGTDVALLGGIAIALITVGVLFARSGRRRSAGARH